MAVLVASREAHNCVLFAFYCQVASRYRDKWIVRRNYNGWIILSHDIVAIRADFSGFLIANFQCAPHAAAPHGVSFISINADGTIEII